MINNLTPQQRHDQEVFRDFADAEIAPRAAAFDSDQFISRELLEDLGRRGYLSASLPQEVGGAGMDAVTYGLMTEEFGRTCSSVRNFVAVADMVAFSIWRWGSEAQRCRWLSPIASGEAIAAFALTEPEVGSDAKNVRATGTATESTISLRGKKKWISFGEIADVFLVFVQLDGLHTAVLIERETPGLAIRPLRDMLGLRGSMLAEVELDDCRVPSENVVGRPGTGLTFVASLALDLGRYSTAWGCVGLAQACLEASVRYSGERVQYDTEIRNHQLVQAMLADIVANTAAARLLCHHAGLARGAGDADAIRQTLIAKYFSSQAASRAATDAVQVHGARGVGPTDAVQRHFRDSKVMEIIEGTTQIHQTMIGHAGQAAVRRAHVASGAAGGQ